MEYAARSDALHLPSRPNGLQKLVASKTFWRGFAAIVMVLIL
jgi:hypothetical protein